MITLLILLCVFGLIFGIGLKITGLLLGALIWACVKLPIACILFAIGIVCCCTIILIPAGIGLFKSAAAVLFPCCII